MTIYGTVHEVFQKLFMGRLLLNAQTFSREITDGRRVSRNHLIDFQLVWPGSIVVLFSLSFRTAIKNSWAMT